MQHIIFIDLDGTLYDFNDYMNPDVKKDIAFAQSKGVEVVFCTGNGAFPKITNKAKELNVRYIISSNGSWIFDMKENKTIYKNVIPFQDAKTLINYANEIGAIIGMWDENAWYASSNPGVKKEVVNKYMGDVSIKHADELQNDVFMITKHGAFENVDLIIDKAKSLGLTSTKIRGDFVEISFGSSTKGKGIEEFCKMYNVDISNTMGIGDSVNDITMFEVVGRSYAMDNAPQIVKDKAMHHAADVKQNGLGVSIIDYLHRERLDRRKNE